MTQTKQPFYQATGHRIVGGSRRRYEVRYFRTEAAAKADAALVPGSYVVLTSARAAIYRSTRPVEQTECHDGQDDSEEIANDRLTAVAPELLAALQHAIDSEIENYTEGSEPSWLVEALAIVAKAKGGA